MSFDWGSYVILAEKLLALSKNGELRDACLRSAISRSYYGVFCIARNFIERKGMNISRVDTHKFVREHYKKSSDPIEQEIGENLKRLSSERNISDYEDTADIDLRRAEAAVKLAKKVLESLKQIKAI